MWFLFGEVSSSSGCLGLAMLFYCDTPCTFHIIILEHYVLKLYKVHINDDPELTMTYFTTMAYLANLDFVLIVGQDIR